MRHLSDNLGVGPIDDLMHILKFCYVYDTRYQCQVCQRLRFIDSPTDLGITPKLPYRCDDCSMLIE
ncbi:hypothetical protein [Psychrobacter sp. FDAARGOS_221]|uniref:hypothetical protein n=1 Tax=Psychrobacter sp. FDAARGOS_221 TaxID=1975705 RepID=UPI000FDBF14F|nr:hypothetical protein [Psychrobacter sp. FDAARGOS_221]